MADYMIDYRKEKEKLTKVIIPPKVLLIRSPNEKDFWFDGVFTCLIDALDKRHIGYTTDIHDLEEKVNLSIVFINKEFLINSSHILHHLVEQNIDNSREFTYVIDESIFSAPGYPKLCTHAECPRLDLLLDEIYCKAAPLFDAAVIHPLTDRAVIHDTIDTFVDGILDYVNPCTLNYSQLCPDLLSHVASLSGTLYAECVIKFPLATEPPLIAILEQGCREVNTTTAELIYTFVKNMTRGRDFSYYFYIDLPHSGYIDGGPRPSLFDALDFAITQHDQDFVDCQHGFNDTTTFFLVIDGLDDFLSKEDDDDPAKVLAKFVNGLGEGSLVIAISTTSITSTIPENTFLHNQTSFGCDVQLERQWPKCSIIWNSQLNELVLNQQVPETVDEMGMCTDDKKEKNVHSINFAVSGSVPKKLKEAETAI